MSANLLEFLKASSNTYVLGVIAFDALVVLAFATRRLGVLKDLGTNLFMGTVGSLAMKLFWAPPMYAALKLADELSPFDIRIEGPWGWLAAFLVSDLAYYWSHRAGHRVRLFWSAHSVHHSSKHYNATTSIRQSVFEGLYRWPAWLPMPLMGFSAEATLASYLSVHMYQVVLHVDWIGKLGPLEGIVNTPSAHRVHHGSNELYHDKNYAAMFTFWDRVFGTYQAETEPVRYGVTRQPETDNPVTLNVFEFRFLWRDFLAARGLGDKLRTLLLPPSWSAAASASDVHGEGAPPTAPDAPTATPSNDPAQPPRSRPAM